MSMDFDTSVHMFLTSLVVIAYVEGKVHPVTCHEGTAALDGDGWSAPLPGRVTFGKEPRCILYGKVGGPGRVRKISPPLGSEP
jgi:hypothetical protein